MKHLLVTLLLLCTTITTQAQGIVWIEPYPMDTLYGEHIIYKCFGNNTFRSASNINNKDLDLGKVWTLDPGARTYMKNIDDFAQSALPIVRKVLEPYIDQINNSPVNYDFKIGYIFDLKGNAIEVYFTYDSNIDIPGTVLEKLENELKNNFKMEFEFKPYHGRQIWEDYEYIRMKGYYRRL